MPGLVGTMRPHWNELELRAQNLQTCSQNLRVYSRQSLGLFASGSWFCQITHVLDQFRELIVR
jgi:hypothetical protein